MRVFEMCVTLISCAYLTLFLENHFVDSFGMIYTVFNATQNFAEFKEKYKKVYNTSDQEKHRYLIFLNNLNAAAALNVTSDGSTVYVLNKYADLDPLEVENRYAIHLKPYSKVKDGDLTGLLITNHGIEINDDNLYNLNNAEELFEQYIEEQKRNITKKLEGFMHFYRFVKTLVEKNRGVFEGYDAPELDEKADVLKESKEYFY